MPVMASVPPFAARIPMPPQVSSVVSPPTAISVLHIGERRLGYVQGLRNRHGDGRRDASERG
ncbi:hypothetical protein ACVJGD_008691 [Bradyrhizobium sp. USDA 10063]